jgi:hypothetical protein
MGVQYARVLTYTDDQVKRSVAIAARIVLAKGRTLMLGRLRAAGAHGADERIMDAAAALERAGELPAVRRRERSESDRPTTHSEREIAEYRQAARRLGLPWR